MGQAQARQQHGKLIPAQPRDIAQRLNVAVQQTADVAQHLVAHVTRGDLVHHAQVVHIDKQQTALGGHARHRAVDQGFGRLQAVRHPGLQAPHEGLAVRQAGEPVVPGMGLDRPGGHVAPLAPGQAQAPDRAVRGAIGGPGQHLHPHPVAVLLAQLHQPLEAAQVDQRMAHRRQRLRVLKQVVQRQHRPLRGEIAQDHAHLRRRHLDPPVLLQQHGHRHVVQHGQRASHGRGVSICHRTAGFAVAVGRQPLGRARGHRSARMARPGGQPAPQRPDGQGRQDGQPQTQDQPGLHGQALVAQHVTRHVPQDHGLPLWQGQAHPRHQSRPPGHGLRTGGRRLGQRLPLRPVDLPQFARMLPALRDIGMRQHHAVRIQQHILQARHGAQRFGNQGGQGQLGDCRQGTGHRTIGPAHGHGQQDTQVAGIFRRLDLHHIGLALGNRAAQRLHPVGVDLGHRAAQTMVGDGAAGQGYVQAVEQPQRGTLLLHQRIQHGRLVQQAGVHALGDRHQQALLGFHARRQHARPQVGLGVLLGHQALLGAGIDHLHQAPGAKRRHREHQGRQHQHQQTQSAPVGHCVSHGGRNGFAGIDHAPL